MPRMKKKAETNPIPEMKDAEFAEHCRVLGDNMRVERRKRGFSIKDVAAYLELSTSYVGLLERGVRSPSMKNFFNLCSLFGVSPDELTRDRHEGESRKVAEKGKPASPSHYDAILSLLKNMSDRELEFVAQMLKNMKDLKRP